ncbi:MAG: carotenoid biosynthesis protein [Methanobacteriota archaeon]|nr:MAG: carotenoid biosynthesis protein [Euryarchaeota archaeon]
MATTTAALGRSTLWLAPVDGLVATAWDLLVDPVAVRSQFWTWISPPALYGVPISNFVGWFVVVTVLSLAARWTWSRDTRAPARMSRSVLLILPGVLLTSGLQFGILGTAYGFFVSTLLGLGIVVPIVGLAWRRLAITPRALFAPNPWITATAVARRRRIAGDDGRT